jgi:hypothetical protein
MFNQEHGLRHGPKGAKANSSARGDIKEGSLGLQENSKAQWLSNKHHQTPRWCSLKQKEST